MAMFKIVLVGNPNIGKTTLFNALTGARQKVGNWPGVTVEKKSGKFDLPDESLTGDAHLSVEVVDLPGIYSLDSGEKGVDEQIARSYLESADADLIVNVVDSCNLRRNLVLTDQLREMGLPMLAVLNMQDSARQRGISVDTAALETRLGIPVVGMSASRREGLDLLLDRICEARRSLSSEPKALANETYFEALDEQSNREEAVVMRYQAVDRMINGVVVVEPREHTLTDQLDRFVLNRWLGIPLFLLVMYLLFTFAVNFGGAFIDFFDILASGFLVDGSRWLLESIATPQLLVTLLSDGLGGGIALVATFVPIIAFLYIGLAFLEDSGYMARAGFVVDRLMSGIGLPGNAFVPLIVGFGCNVPAVMATRTMAQQNDRLLTIAMAPFMSCGARLTVYVLFAAAFFPGSAQNVVFLLYLMGVVVAIATGYIFRKQIFPGEVTPSVQEMPAYQAPIASNIFYTAWFRLQGFIRSAGKTIVMVVVALSFLNSIGTDGSFGHEDSEQSVLSAIGKSITPAFAPIGITEDNWPATVGLFTGMFAKEAIVGTLDALYVESDEATQSTSPPAPADLLLEALGSVADAFSDAGSFLIDPLGIRIGDVSDQASVASDQSVATGTLTEMASRFESPLAAFAYLSLILLYAPCVAVVGAMVRESGARWAALVFCWSTAVGYFVALVIYQLGQLVAQPVTTLLILTLALFVMALMVSQLKRFAGQKKDPNVIAAVNIT